MKLNKINNSTRTELIVSIIKILSLTHPVENSKVYDEIKTNKLQLNYEQSKVVNKAERITSFLLSVHKNKVNINKIHVFVTAICTVSDTNMAEDIVEIPTYESIIGLIENKLTEYKTKNITGVRPRIRMFLNDVDYSKLVREPENQNLIVYLFVNIILLRANCCIIIEPLDQVGNLKFSLEEVI